MNINLHSVEPEIVMAYRDGQLSADEAAEIRAHLEECAECRALVADLEQVSVQMREWTIESPSPQLTWRVAAASAGARRPALRRWFWPVAAFASVVLIWCVLPQGGSRWHSATGSSARSQESLALRAQPQRGVAFQAWSEPSVGAPSIKTGPYDGLRLLQEPQLALKDARGHPGGVIGGIAADKRAATRGLAPMGPMVARDASLTLAVKDFPQAREGLGRIVVKHHGYVQNLASAGQPSAGRALTATLRFPTEELEPALAELRVLGTVDQESQNGEDVLQQHVDLSARLSNARVTEKRLNELLAQRTGKMDDVLEVEREITRVREEIEGMEEQLRGMNKRVELATVSLRVNEVVEKAPPQSAWSRLWTAFGDGFGGLRDDLVITAEFLLYFLPHLIFWSLVLFLPGTWIWRKFGPDIRASIARWKKDA
jgi:hypothetical protein